MKITPALAAAIGLTVATSAPAQDRAQPRRGEPAMQAATATIAPDNVVRLRDALSAAGRGDFGPISTLVSPGLRMHGDGASPLGGEHSGPDHRWGELGKLSGGTLKSVPVEVTGAGDLAVVLFHVTASRNGRSLDTHVAEVWRFENGRGVEIWDHLADRATWDAFWAR